MMRSPAYRSLSLSGHRILARVEIELASHGGRDNGKLPVTFADFEEFGVHQMAIAPGIREACALGLLEVTRRGAGGHGEFRTPNLFRLPYLPAYGKGPTHEWRRIKTIEKAEQIARKVRRTIKKRRPRKTGPVPPPENVLKTAPGKRGETPKSPPPENGVLSRHLAISPTAGLRGDHQHQRRAARRAERARRGGSVTFHRTNQTGDHHGQDDE